MQYAETLCCAMYFCLQFLYLSLIYAEYLNTGFSNYDKGHAEWSAGLDHFTV
jgi:hypothetical protein